MPDNSNNSNNSDFRTEDKFVGADVKTAGTVSGVTNVESENEIKIEQIAKELQVILPKSKEPLGIRIIALLSLVGGLSLLGGTVTDIFNQKLSLFKYLVRGGSGIIFLAIAYGLIRGRRWAMWLFGAVVLVGLFVNPGCAIIPLFIFLYIWSRRSSLRPDKIDYWLEKKVELVKARFRKYLG